MKKLIILDYSSGEVHIYFVNNELTIDEEYIENLGFHTDECEWMFGNLSIEIH